MHDRPNRLTVFGAIVLYGWFALLAAGTTFGTFSLVYYSDDLDHLQRVAQLRSGQTGVAEFFLRPHNEQTLPLVRAMYWIATLRGGFEATLMRLQVVLLHAAGAFACALLVFYSTGSMTGAWFGGSVYAAAAGYIASVVWAPSSAIFCLGGVGLAFSYTALASPIRNRRLALALSLAAAGFAIAGMNGTGIGFVGVPVFCWLMHVALPIPIRRVGLLFIGLGAAVLAAAHWNAARIGGQPALAVDAGTILTALWFPFSAMGRFVLSWWTYDPPGVPGIAAAAALAWIAALASLYLLDRKKRWLLASLWVAPSAIACLVALGRAQDKLGPLYVTDRYYYFFLLPLSVHVGILAVPVLRATRPVLAAALLLAFALCAIASRSRYLASVPLYLFRNYETAFTSGSDLVARIDRSPRPLLLADGRLPFDGVRHGFLSLRCLIYTLHPRGLQGVEFSAHPLSAQQSAVQNAILDEWAAAEGRDSRACVSNGRLEPTRLHVWLDFSSGSYEEMIGQGIWERQGGRRYLGRSGDFRLRSASGEFVVRATSIMSDLRRRWPELAPLRVRADVDGSFVEDMIFEQSGDREFRFPATAIPRDGREVVATLTADRVWRPNELNPSNLDSRELSIEVRAIGFPSAAGGSLLRCAETASANVKH